MRYIVYEFNDYFFNDALIDSFYIVFQPILEGPTSMETIQIEKELIFFRLRTDYLDIDIKFRLENSENDHLNGRYQLSIVSKNENLDENDIQNLCKHLYFICSIDNLDDIPIETKKFLSKYFITVWNLKKMRTSKRENDFSQMNSIRMYSSLC